MSVKREKGALQGEIPSRAVKVKETTQVPRCKHPLLGKTPAEPRGYIRAETLFLLLLQRFTFVLADVP